MRRAVVRIALVVLGMASGFLLRGCLAPYGAVTLTSLSPDDTLRIRLIERGVFIDRNIQVRLEDIDSGRERVAFRSPDEGRPAGSERIIWSADGRRFLLLGRHFIVPDRSKLPGGEQAYLMMDVRSGQVWCNSQQQSRYPGFGLEELRAVAWLGWAPS